MDLFDLLALIGGLSLFLFGMNLMGSALERRAGERLKHILSRLTTGRIAGFLTGLGVTAIIQSSSATTVMVVGFVNSGLMTLRQAINVIMGANVGTTVTAWLLSLTAIDSSNLFVQLLKPTSFTPILALIGIVMMMGGKSGKTKDTATILLGFATLMFGMDAMSASVSGLKEVEAFRNLLVMFENPIPGVLAGALITGIIQSSSASVGILQALSSTGQVTIGASIPIIMGQNIGTTVTALLSSVGTNRTARRASLVHLIFNVIGTVVLLSLFMTAQAIFPLEAFTSSAANEVSIAVAHSVFNILCTAMLLPCSHLLEKLSYRLLPETPAERGEEQTSLLDERLMATPTIALEQCRVLTDHMASRCISALHDATSLLQAYDPDVASGIRLAEREADRLEDELGSYLVKLGNLELSDESSTEAAKLLYMIGDLERISDHAASILDAVEEMREKDIRFTPDAMHELDVMSQAVNECAALTLSTFASGDIEAGARVEPLEQTVATLKSRMRANHIARMQRGQCSIEAGFVWADLLTDCERVCAHCSNLAGCVIEMSHATHALHGYLRSVRMGSEEYRETLREYEQTYSI